MKKTASDLVWLLMGLTGSAPCTLACENGELTLTLLEGGALHREQLRDLENVAHVPDLSDRVERGERVELFRAPIVSVRAAYPWYSFGAGCNLVVGGTRYRLSFLQPQNTLTRDESISGLANTAQSIAGGRARGKAWRQRLRVDAERAS
ncbi:MAG: hypothetical protein Q7T01_02165 [bacterium]|nr:hypothetical protein [bacterium]